jgi:putative ABC transport system permease protein
LWSENLVAYTIDTRATIYIAGIAVATGIAIGLAPAWRLASTSRGNLIDAGGRSGTLGRAAGRFVGALVVAELALAVVLLSGAGALTRSFANKSAAPLGIDPANTLAMLVNLPQQAYSEPSTRISFFDRLQTRLSAIPGVQSVSIASALPTGNGQPLVYESAGSPNSKDPQTVTSLTVGPQYFASFGVSLLAGRDFSSADSDNSTKVVIVNRAFAETEWPGLDPLGRQLWINRQRSDSRIVVGVAPDILQGDPYRTRGHLEPVVYLPFRQRPIPNVWVLARTNTPLAVTASFRRELQSLDPDLAAWLGPLTVEEHISGYGNYWIIAGTAVLFLVFSIVGVVLAAIGLYGVMAQSMRQRTREIGVRMAIGARPADVLMLVLSRALWQVSLGLAAGLALAPFLTRLLGSYLGDVSPADPTTMGLACLVLTVSVACACVIPVRRSLRVDPVVVLKTD